MTEQVQRGTYVHNSFEEYLLRIEHQEYIDNFDPSPQNYGDDYSAPADFDTWLLEREEECLTNCSTESK